MPTVAQTQLARATVRKYGRKTTWRQRIKGGAHRTPSEFPKAALVRGVEIELEHTDDPLVAMEIAMDHLDEQLDYYEKLKEVEGNPKSVSEKGIPMNHPSFNIPQGLAVAWAPESRTYVVLEGDGPVADRRVIMHNPDAAQLQSWLDTQTPQANPHHGRKHNGAGLGAFLGSLSAGLLGALISGGTSAPLAVLLSMAGGGAGGYYFAEDDRKKRGAVGGTVGGILGPLFAALGGYIGGRHPDKQPLKKRRNPASSIMQRNPEARLSYEETLYALENGDTVLAARWIGVMGPEEQSDPDLQRLTAAALIVLRSASADEIDDAIEVFREENGRSPMRNPEAADHVTVPVANPHGHAHKWWEAEGHCCEACAIEQPCSGEENCTLPTKTNPGRKSKKIHR